MNTLTCDVMLVGTDDYKVTRTIRRIQKWLARTGAPVQIRSVSGYIYEGLTSENVWDWAVARSWTVPEDALSMWVVRGAGGFAGGNAELRTAVVGDVVIEALKGETAKALSFLDQNHFKAKHVTRDAQIGTLLHEMSHMSPEFTHEDGGIMSQQWNWPFVGWPGVPKWRVWLNALRWKLDF